MTSKINSTKRYGKKIAALLLACCMAVGMLLAAPQSVCAKGAPGVKVTFNGKTAVFAKQG